MFSQDRHTRKEDIKQQLRNRDDQILGKAGGGGEKRRIARGAKLV